jgi:ligand-binding sensor domain-containing protein/signal transduction histidine kinase
MKQGWLNLWARCARVAAVVGLGVAVQFPVAAAADPGESPGFVARNWGVKDGLPQNTVTAMAQTRDGYLWLGTMAGLARFDGVRFKVFGLAEGLPNVQVRALLEDSAGDLWIGTTGGGLCRLRNDRIESVQGEALKGDENVTALALDARGWLWIGTSDGLVFWTEGRLTRDPSAAPIPRGLIRALLPDRAGVMWVSSVNGLFAVADGAATEAVGPAPDNRFSPYCLLEDRAGNLWASIGNGKMLCRTGGQWRCYDQSAGVPFAYVTCLAEDPSGTVWAGSLDAGLYFFRGDNFHRLSGHNGLSGGAIRSLLSDREGNLWVGHRTLGLDRLIARRVATLGADRGLTNDYVRCVAETEDGTLWLGTTGGGLYRTGGDQLQLFTNTVFNTYYPFVEAALTTRDGSLWWGGGGSLFCWQSNRIQTAFTSGRVTVAPNSVVCPWLLNAAVTALWEDGDGQILVGTSVGQVIRLRGEQWEIIPHRLGRGAITSLVREPDGTLWVGSLAGGLVRWRGETLTSFAPKDGFPANHVRVIHRSRDGTLWIGTGGGGLLRLQGERLTRISNRDGLGDDTISQILEDGAGNLWLGGNRGIFRVRRSELDELAERRRSFVHPQAYGLNDGMLAEECTGGSSPVACRLRSGKLAFATVRGVVIVDPRAENMEATPPRVLIEEVSSDRLVQRFEPVTAPGPNGINLAVTIPAGRRECEFHYTGLSFQSPERIRFRYQLEGVDEDWVEAGSRRVAYYNPLRPGHYVFRVTAGTTTGVWSEREASLLVVVQPHFWETPWFRVLTASLALLTLGTTVFMIARRRYKRRLAALMMQHAIERERLRISQDMHDQVGSILTRVSILSDTGQSDSGGEPARRHFERIGTQVRAAVQGLDEIVWTTNPKNDNLPRFAEYVGRFADECFENTRIRCWQEIPTQLPHLPLRAELRHNVFLAIKETLNNALKHSGADTVWLRMSLSMGRFTVEIEDNGRGFTPATLSPGGNGLENIRSRLADVGGSATVQSTPGQGTKVTLTFSVPVND